MIKSSAQLVQEAKSDIKEVSIQDLNNSLSPDTVLIDVREPGEYSQSHIAQAVNYPRGVLEMNLAQHPSVKSEAEPLEVLSQKDIFLICRSGARSALAAKSLQTMGFEKVVSVAGGMLAWQEAGLDTGS